LQTNPYGAISQSTSYYNASGNTTTTNTTQFSSTGAYATPFQFTFSDNALNIYAGYYAALLRWYPELNSYLKVDMGKTDSVGQSVMYLVTNDVDYRIALYDVYGNLVKLTDPSRFVCSAAPCSYTVRIDTSQGNWKEWLDIQRDLSYNETSKTFTFTWNDPSGKSQSMRLEVYKVLGQGSILICNTTGLGSTGALSCNASVYTGILSAEAFRTASPENPIATLLVTVVSTIFKGQVGLYVTFIIWLIIMLMGLWNPMSTILFSVIGIIPAIVFGSFPLQILFSISIIGGVALYVMKKVS
jgi:hypothetical protein